MSEAPALAGCDHYGLVSIHHGARGIVRRKVQECWTCKRRTPFVIRWDGAYYGTTEWCVVCLDGWQDGYRLTRPFARYWKRDRAAEIKARWDAAMLPARYRSWVDYDVHRATCNHFDTERDEACAQCETRPA